MAGCPAGSQVCLRNPSIARPTIDTQTREAAAAEAAATGRPVSFRAGAVPTTDRPTEIPLDLDTTSQRREKGTQAVLLLLLLLSVGAGFLLRDTSRDGFLCRFGPNCRKVDDAMVRWFDRESQIIRLDRLLRSRIDLAVQCEKKYLSLIALSSKSVTADFCTFDRQQMFLAPADKSNAAATLYKVLVNLPCRNDCIRT